MKYTLLIVDDEPANLRMLERLFREDHDVVTAESGSEALEILTRNDVALIISDQRMPGMLGIDFLKKAAQLRPRTVRIILTGYTDVADLVEAVNCGAVYKYITKPWINTDLQQTVRRAIEHYKATRTHSTLEQENERLDDRLRATVRGFVNTLSEMISQKSSKLGEHCRRTSELAALIGTWLNLEPGEMENLTLASLLHELPNIRMPFKMDFNKSALTAEQFHATQDNYENSLRLISNVPDLEEVASIISYQHENFDGTGLFNGLDGERIPLLSRILAVANMFDEINSGRDPALFCTEGTGAAWLRRWAGSRLDPKIVEVCLMLQLSPAARILPAAALTMNSQPIDTLAL